MTTKETIKSLKIGETITEKTNDPLYVQRIRNYCHDIKKEDESFRAIVKVKKGVMTIKRIKQVTHGEITNLLRSMESGDTEYIERSISVVSGSIARVDGEFEVKTVTKVVKKIIQK